MYVMYKLYYFVLTPLPWPWPCPVAVGVCCPFRRLGALKLMCIASLHFLVPFAFCGGFNAFVAINMRSLTQQQRQQQVCGEGAKTIMFM